MFAENLLTLRKLLNLSQEELAGRVGVTRQTLSKWECGESLPDLDKAQLLADALDVSLDELNAFDMQAARIPPPPKGKHFFGTVHVGEKGQIVIPAKARKLFRINPGDSLIVLGDDATGIALLQEKEFMKIVEQIKISSAEGDPQ